MAGWVNRNELRVIGMSRSGNHAIVQWILAQAAGRVCFLNCVQGKANPLWTARPVVGEEQVASTNYAEFDLAAEREGRFSEKDWLIYSYEDEFLGNACSNIFEDCHDAWVGPSQRWVDVLILRDAFNLFASRLRLGHGEISPQVAVRIWKQHAKEFLGRTRRLRHVPVLISYNRWVVDREYRRDVAEALGLAFTDAGVRTVSPCAGGSSFDGMNYDGRADQMKVFERWKEYEQDPSYLALMEDEVRTLSGQIFGLVTGWEADALQASGECGRKAGRNGRRRKPGRCSRAEAALDGSGAAARPRLVGRA